MALQSNLGLGFFSPPTAGSILCRHAHKVTYLKLAVCCEEFRAISLATLRNSAKNVRSQIAERNETNFTTTTMNFFHVLTVLAGIK